jgi:ribA/ribD-fused uncharacterized protein
MASDLFGDTIINDFHDGVHDFLSNFYYTRLVVWGVEFPTSEHAFQWAKSPLAAYNAATVAELGSRTTPGQAKRRGNQVTLRPDWNDVQENGMPLAFNVMLEVCRAKFQDSLLADSLLATGDATIIEGNTWHDNTWGACSCSDCAHKAKNNWLGKILMHIREELKKK